MPRQARLDAPCVLQHVMARGIERRKIFWDDKDRSFFLERFAVVLEETQTQCYAWALIPNHFHILLRTGATPLSTVMRRLMTGYAVTFNIRHRRSGHLFQNRYKSVVCEEDPYLLELIRYIHLNPLRARLVEDLKSLDKYPWSGHSVLIGKQKNPLVPKIPPAIEEDKYLAEKTVEDVLLHFGKTLKEARRRYREFVEKGIKQGRREDLQGGGLMRSSGGDRAALIGLKKEEREKGDERILGSGDFVNEVLGKSAEEFERSARRRPSLQELMNTVGKLMGVAIEDLRSSSRKRSVVQARAVVSYFAVRKFGYKGAEVGKALSLAAPTVSQNIEKGKILLDSNDELKYKLQ
ncbi:MAG: transposase [Thermodesulfobacteriota bacterium]|nr:transposase [Thermodesulfobacteriota bacterium]